MKKLVLATFFGLMISLLSGCAGLSQEDRQLIADYRKIKAGEMQPNVESSARFERFNTQLQKDLKQSNFSHLILVCEAGFWEVCLEFGLDSYPDMGKDIAELTARAKTSVINACHPQDLKTCAEIGEELADRSADSTEGKLGKDFLKLACDGNLLSSCVTLGTTFANPEKFLGSEATQKNEARTYFTKACDGKYAPGCLALGKSLIHHEVDNKFHSQAQTAFQTACKLDSVEGCLELGVALLKKPTTQQGVSEALRIYEKHCVSNKSIYLDRCVLMGIFLKSESDSAAKTPGISPAASQPVPRKDEAAIAQPAPKTEPAINPVAPKLAPEPQAISPTATKTPKTVPAAPIPEAKRDPCEGLANGQAVRIKVKGEPQPQSAMVLKASDGQVQVRIMGSGLRERRACSEVQKGN